MKRNYYIFSSGKLIRKQNTLYFEPGKAEEPEEENYDSDEIEVGDESLDNTTDIDADEPRKIRHDCTRLR